MGCINLDFFVFVNGACKNELFKVEESVSDSIDLGARTQMNRAECK